MAAQQPNPYAPPTAQVADAVEHSDELQIAGRGTRLGAYVVDILVSLLFATPAMIAGGASLLTGLADASPEAMLALVSGTFGLLLVAGMLAYAVITIILVHKNGQTIGKKLLGIKVVRKEGARASLGRIFWLRNVVNALPSMIPVVGGLYFFIDSLFIFSESNQCVHDKIADTIVVKA
jgi:uncharacterized RDD family membrane protein YckC